MALYNSVLDTIGRTPIVRLNHIAPKHVSVYVKVESFNPGGSVKDRLALAIILDAERRGVLKPGDTIVEATSGNTGVALAMVAAARGYKFVATMVETFSVERRKLMRAYGARVILTPAAERGTGMVRRAKELGIWGVAYSGSAEVARAAVHGEGRMIDRAAGGAVLWRRVARRRASRRRTIKSPRSGRQRGSRARRRARRPPRASDAARRRARCHARRATVPRRRPRSRRGDGVVRPTTSR